MIMLKKYHPYQWKMQQEFKDQVKNRTLDPATWFENDPHRSAKRAFAIVIGTVKSIQHNRQGPYHTWITVSVDSSVKNEVGHEVLLKLLSGPFGDQGRSMFLSYEPKFVLNERVLVLLSRIPGVLWWQGGPGYSHATENVKYSSYYAEHIKTTQGYYEVSRKYEILPDNKIMIKGKKRLLSSILHGIDQNGGQ